MSTQELTTVSGYLRALPKDASKNDAPRAALVTDGGEEYHILHKGVGIDLLAHINADVILTGVVSHHEEAPHIFVRSYSLADAYDRYDDSLYDAYES